MPQYCGLVRTLHQTLYTVTSVSVTGLRSSRTRANKLVSIVSRFFWLVLSNLISLSRSWERKSKKQFSLHNSLDCSRERWVSHRGRSLRSKRFSVVSEQKENEERRGTGLSVFVGRKMGWEPKMKEAGRGTSLPPHPLPVLLLATFFARSFDTHSLFFAPKRHGNACYADYRAQAGRRLVSGSEGFAVYGSLLIMSLRGGVVGRPLYKQEPWWDSCPIMALDISYTVCAAIKSMIFLLLLVSCAAPPFYPHTNSPNWHP